VKFLHVTDTHLVPSGQRLHGLDPAARLAACVRRIRERDDDAAFCIITGDVADAGAADAYALVRQLLAELPMPVHLIPGNHDHRGRFLEAFPDTPLDEHGFVQYQLEHGDAVFLLLDTLEPAHGAAGGYCARRARWLAQRLEQAGERPVFLFMHHPPFDVGLPGLDEIGIRDLEPFLQAMGSARNVQHLFFGHVHRPICGQWRGIAFSTLYGTNHQTALTPRDTEWLTYTAEPPAYAVVLVEPDRVLVHTHLYDVDDRAIGGHPTIAAARTAQGDPA
jgi:3',5'-cyclic AMP phosphodiesterase CpdA